MEEQKGNDYLTDVEEGIDEVDTRVTEVGNQLDDIDIRIAALTQSVNSVSGLPFIQSTMILLDRAKEFEKYIRNEPT